MNHEDVGLTLEEYEIIKKDLGRAPNDLELRLSGVMWSEHCSYKSTRPLLRLFPTKGEAVVNGPGENAGVVSVGEGLGLAFKVESHNHPSAVAPYQGAATGVGGIIRDILAMGARPIASMDGLFFGDPTSRKTEVLSDGIVRGIGGYGNAVGVPTIGGKTFYDKSYTDNPLVNAFCAGIVKLDQLTSSKTAACGQLVLLLGAKTGRDGIAGAAFASKRLSEDTALSKPQIQIGDPFEGKLLIEACMDLLEKKLIVGMQDMGAAGILSSSSEIAYKSGVGMEIYVEDVPLREKDMEPWEIFLSESQERMLLIATPEALSEIEEIARHYDLDLAVIGKVVEGDRYQAYDRGFLIADLPTALLGGGCPEILRPQQPPSDLEDRWNLELSSPPAVEDFEETLLSLLSSPHLREKSGIWRQYDSMIQLNTVTGPGKPVSVLRLKGMDRFLVFCMEADPWKCHLDPYRGATETMAQALRVLWVCGAVPLGMTNCLNYPSPEVPEQFWELAESVRGLADTCLELDCPVVSGNVSLYNESGADRILPTPLVCPVGLIEHQRGYLDCSLWEEGDLLFLVGSKIPSLAGSLYAETALGLHRGRPLEVSFEHERDFRSRALKTAHVGVARSVRLLAGGGLAAALAKEAVGSGKGATIEMASLARPEVLLFGEGGPRALYAVPPEKKEAFCDLWKGFPLEELGRVHGDRLRFKSFFDTAVEALKKALKGEH